MGVNWIMGCLLSANFVVLVNGTPSKFFSASRGIRQGCPLSPLLFILVIEGLSLLIKDARDAFTHLLFMDDVILLGAGTFAEWLALRSVWTPFARLLE